MIKLQQCGINATYLGTSQRDPKAEEGVINGKFNIVYITPEKLDGWETLLSGLHRNHPITLVAIDEVRSLQ